MESGGMTSSAKQFDVQRIDDIIALIALYRPGPMDLIRDYIKRKKGTDEDPLRASAARGSLRRHLRRDDLPGAGHGGGEPKLAGYSLGQADLLRRAMGKKDKEKMAKERANFIEGCAETNKIPEKKANAIFDLLEKFAGYGFNKSHSAAYGLISYQTAYLKANYPVEFMAGLLSNEINNTDKISVFVGECKRMGSDSAAGCEPQRAQVHAGDGAGRCSVSAASGEDPAWRSKGIRYGLAAIKNVGEGAMETALRERESGGEFNSLEDFCRRLDSRIAIARCSKPRQMRRV
jgi:DNA polymerase-3 subunit alpha